MPDPRGICTAILTVVLLVLLLGAVCDDTLAAETVRVDREKLRGRWFLKQKWSDEECSLWFDIDSVTADYQLTGKDVYDRVVQGYFEPTTRSWPGYLGGLVLYSPTSHLAGYGSARPVFSLGPADVVPTVGPGPAPGVVRTFDLFDTQVARGATIGSADRVYRCPTLLDVNTLETPVPRTRVPRTREWDAPSAP